MLLAPMRGGGLKYFPKPKPNCLSLDTAIPFYSRERERGRHCRCPFGHARCHVRAEREEEREGDLSVPHPVERQLRQSLSLGQGSV